MWNIWILVIDIPYYKIYFPGYQNSELPEPQYIFDILCIISPNAVAGIIQDARKNRGLVDVKDTQQLIEIFPEYWSEISQLVKIKGKIKKNDKPRSR